MARLARLTVAERREVAGLHPDRAPTIVAGAAILLESMRAFGLDEVEVSEQRHPARRRTGRLKMKAPASCRRLQKRPHQDGQGYVP